MWHRKVRSKRVYLSGLVCVLASGVIGCTAPSVQGSEEAIYDFGTIREGEVLEHTFSFQNHSNERLNILSNTSSCSCTILKVVPEFIEPHATIELPVSLRTSHKGGRISEEVILRLSSGRIQRFILQATVCGELIESLDFGKLLQGKMASAKVEVPWCGGSRIKEDDLQYDPKYLDVSLEEDSEEFKLTSLVVTTSDRSPFGYFLQNITVTNKEADIPQRIIQVAGSVRNLAEAEPDVITLGDIEPGQTVNCRLNIVSPYNKHVEVSSILDEKGERLKFVVDEQSEDAMTLVISLSVTETVDSAILKKILTINCIVEKTESVILNVEAYGFLTSQDSS
ncbi:MAG: DUF1573 domain-containing protein [Candidatus Hydrogenedentes bacterium]|nr:DUF1573 domain-containing protein [Candidatus Hydrogenedentota bacterium]